MVVGDTDFFIDLMAAGSAFHRRAEGQARDLASRGATVYLTAPSRYELLVGVQLADRPADELERVLTRVAGYPTLALTSEAADVAGRLQGALQAEGRGIGVVDALIAGIALLDGEGVLTRNVREFSRIPGLSVETY